MKKELLAPAGNMDCLKAAIHNGADAIYLAGKAFGARKFAKNFTNDELIEAIKYAHLYGVKIFVTVNTIIYEDEINECLEYLTFLYNIGVDAVIVQDVGLIKLIRKYLPDLEIHASTQAHTHNIEQIKLLESLGVKRVVLARELSLDEINKLDTNMELEIFIHGALCISYSGQCLFSSGVLNRSGNRGECAGLCRLPYNLIENYKTILKDKYLLSPKEFNSTDYVELLKKSKAYSFKIEGRMKSPEYVGYVTRIYRKLLDNDNYILSEEEVFNLKSLYNRGFTKGYLFNNTDSEFISLNSSNHQGVEIGKVIDVNKDKIKIKLDHSISQGDAVRLPNDEGMYINFLYNDKMLLVSSAKKNDIVYIDNKVNLNTKGRVLLTINKTLVDELANTLEKKIKIDAYVYAHVGESLIIKYTDGKNEVEYIGATVDMAKNSPLIGDRIKEVISKLGNTPFVINNVKLDIDDNMFIPVGVLNEIRRNLIQNLIHKRTDVNRNVNINIAKGSCCKRSVNAVKISALARNAQQVEALLKLNVDTIYVINDELYNKYKDKGVYKRLNRVLSKFENYNNVNLLIGETGSLKYVNNNSVITDYYLNVVNSSYLNYLDSLGVKRITISPELSIERIKLMLQYYNGNAEVEMICYGTLEYMIMKYNLIDNMKLNINNKYSLEDKNKNRFIVYNDGYTHLMSYKKINRIDEITELASIGVSTFRLELFDETKEEIVNLINKIKN